MTNNRKIDWISVERDYRAGGSSVREIARWHDVSEAAIRKRAKSEGWNREPASAAPRAVTDRSTSVVLAAVPAQFDPRDVITRGRRLTLAMLDELEATTSLKDELLTCIDRETEGDSDDGARRAALHRVLDLPVRAATLKSLALAFKTFGDALAPAGKKVLAQEDAEEAGQGSLWGDDLLGPRNSGDLN